MENKLNYATVFGTIDLLSEEHLEAILASMNDENAKYLAIQALNYAYNNNTYTLGEAEILAKIIRIFNRKQITEEVSK
jgi:hypothetical protein